MQGSADNRDLNNGERLLPETRRPIVRLIVCRRANETRKDQTATTQVP